MRVIQLRTSNLATKGLPSTLPSERRCGAGCARNETLCHVLQACPNTHAPRIKRHDHVVSKWHRIVVGPDGSWRSSPAFIIGIGSLSQTWQSTSQETSLPSATSRCAGKVLAHLGRAGTGKDWYTIIRNSEKLPTGDGPGRGFRFSPFFSVPGVCGLEVMPPRSRPLPYHPE